MSPGHGDARQEWRAAWPLPFVAMIGNTAATMFGHTSGVFMPLVTKEFGWTRTEFSAGLSFALILALFGVPAVGVAIDRLGARRVAFVGIPTFALAFAAFGLASGAHWQWLVQCAFYAALSALVNPVVWVTAVASRFAAARGVALAIVLSGAGLNGAVYPLLATWYAETFGWRLAYAAVAATWFLSIAPLALLFFRSAQDVQTKAERTRAPRQPLSAYRAALMSRGFITLVLAVCLFAVMMLAFGVHLIPILREHGMSPTAAAAIAGLSGAFSIVGRLIAGVLLDRFSPKWLGAIAFSMPILTCSLLLYGGGTPGAGIAAAVLLGLAMGAELDIVSYLIARYFGLKQFGGLYGVLLGFMGFAAGFGPVFASWIADRTNGYDTFLLAIMPAFAVGAALIATLPNIPRAPDEDLEERPPEAQAAAGT